MTVQTIDQLYADGSPTAYQPKKKDIRDTMNAILGAGTVNADGLMAHLNALSYAVQSLSSAQQSQARSNIGALGSGSGLSSDILGALSGPEVEVAIGQGPRRITYTTVGNYVLNADDFAPGAAHLFSAASGTFYFDIATMHISREYQIDVIGAACWLVLDCGAENVIQGAFYSPSQANNTTLIVPSDHTVTLRKYAGGKIIAQIDTINGFWRSVATNNWSRRMADGTYEYRVLYTSPISSGAMATVILNSAYNFSAARVRLCKTQPSSGGSAVPECEVTRLGTAGGLDADNKIGVKNTGAAATTTSVYVEFDNVTGPSAS